VAIARFAAAAASGADLLGISAAVESLAQRGLGAMHPQILSENVVDV
jgi:hypothetical protein